MTWREGKRVSVTIGLAIGLLTLFAALIRWMAAVESNQDVQKAGIAAQLESQRAMTDAINYLSIEIGRISEWHDAVNDRLDRLEDRR